MTPRKDVLQALKAKPGTAADLARRTFLPQRTVLVLLRDLEGYSYQEIAAITGLDMAKVKVYLFRARRALQEYIGDVALVA